MTDLKFISGFWAVVFFVARKTSDELLPLEQRVILGWMSIGDGQSVIITITIIIIKR